MSTFSKKFVSTALAATTTVWASGALLLFPVANAQTATDLQAQISALLAQIAQLQAQLGTSGSSVTSYNFTRNLTVGSTGADVKALQQFLNSHGAPVAASGVGSVGNESTYFGAKTKAALAAWQASVGISPAIGYFGPITMARVNSMTASTGTGTGTGTGTTYIPAPASGLSVSLSASNPASGALISSSNSAAARVPVLGVNFTAGTSGAVTVNQIAFKKVGVISDNSISSAYLTESGKVVAQYVSLNNGVITFSGLNWTIGAGQTRTLQLAIDPSTGLSAGNTVAFSINAATDISAMNASGAAVTVGGTFPTQGNTFTVTTVTNPQIATVTLASSSVGTTVFAGTPNSLVSQWTATVSNSAVNLASLNFRVVGSAAKSDIRNVVMKVNGIAVGAPLASVNADGSAYFDLTSSPVKLQTGSNNIQIYADVMGSPSFNFDFGVLNSYDVYAIDTQYSIPVVVTVNGGGTGTSSGHQVSIQQGQITVSLDSSSPTNNIALGGSGVTLAKYRIYAAGEALKVKFLQVKLTSAGGTLDFTTTTATAAGVPDKHIKNLALIDDAGNQVGTTINSLVDPGTAGSGQCDATSATITTCNFGTSGSNVNYIIPANTTRVLSVRADIQSTASFTTLEADLVAQSQNLQGLTSSQTNSTGGVTGSALTLASTPLTVTANGAVASQTYAKGAAQVKVGSYVFTASSAEGVTVSNFTVSANASSSNFQNLVAKVGGQQVGQSYGTLSNSTNYAFSGNIDIPVGGTAIVDLFADVLTATTGQMGALTSFVSCTGQGKTTFTSISCSGTPTGQSITISSGPTLSVNSTNAIANRQVRMGTQGVRLAQIVLSDTAGIEPIRLQELKFNMTTPGATVGAAFSNLKLYDASGNAIAGAGPISMTSAAPSFVADFNFGGGNVVVVPQAGSAVLELRGDVTAFSTGISIENASTTIGLNATTTANIVAYGQASNAAVTVSTNSTTSLAALTKIHTLRSKLTLSGTTLGTDSACGSATGPSTHSKTTTDYVLCLKLSPDGSGVRLNSIALRLAGTAISTASTFQIKLLDPSTGFGLFDGSSAQTCDPTTGGNSCSVTFTFNGTEQGDGVTKGIAVQLDSSNFFTSANQVQPLDINVNTSTAVVWGDGNSGIGATPTNLNLSSDVATPLNLAHILYQ